MNALRRMAAEMAAEKDDEPVVVGKWKRSVEAPPSDADRLFEELPDVPPQTTKPKAAPSTPLPLLERTPTGSAPEAGVKVLAKGPSKLSLADLEMLKKTIVIKGLTTVIDGFNLDAVKWDDAGLVPVIAQDRATGAVLLQAWCNREALAETLKSRKMTYWHRKRDRLWVHGEESGRVQKLVEIRPDCDSDSLLAIVEQQGPACHRDTATCWSEGRDPFVAGALGEMDRRLAKGPKDPKKAAGRVRNAAEAFAKAAQGKSKDGADEAAAELLEATLAACRARGVGLPAVLQSALSRAPVN
ncbi:MAG TPA: phosphoribosyl-AMP cyclohydrolase [Candidatus Thermoplasmatota archaeon]|nr:phosphoribosyl-AMP cyclohydrolase [Candidatus Thermoplasmatota archaeon]